MKSRALKYIGSGSAWVAEGQAPIARDLEPDEVEQYGGEAVLLASGLFVVKDEVKHGDKQ